MKYMRQLARHAFKKGTITHMQWIWRTKSVAWSEGKDVTINKRLKMIKDMYGDIVYLFGLSICSWK